jgi:large subunit ribosomal protein L23
MKLNIFNKEEDKKKKKGKATPAVKAVEPTEEVSEDLAQSEKEVTGIELPKEADSPVILRSFYVSEKSSSLGMLNQYVFKVFDVANKSEIKKQVEKMFKVKVKAVKVMNSPGKRRDSGRHPGFKPGYKKAIVVLEEGNVISQVKP